ncbi:hypothetical protein CDEST_04465 [Colletotrichum destructivum]|uniref:Uncharacterized protein n=1 Tax=Colletotrichum destructivum TaxID=34406 RepID=A0AAX4I8Q1_9PEZI|nr:hypothetical protein CDEST_04465 [Colletotrichum destructivum]
MARDGHRDIAVPPKVVPSAATTLPTTGKITGSQGQAQRCKRFQPSSIKTQTVPAVKASRMTKRLNDTAEILEPLFAAAPCLLLCTGSPDNATITAVPVGDDADPVAHWKALQGAVQKGRSFWTGRTWPRLTMVTLRIVSRHSLVQDSFCGQFQPVDVRARIEQLRSKASELGFHHMRVYNPDHSDFYCRYNAVTDTVEHGIEVCRRYKDDDSPRDEGEELGYCEIPEHVDRLREIERLELVSIWPKLLEDPSLAEMYDVIHEGWIYSSKDVMPLLETTHLYSVAQIEFVGFHVAQRPGESWAGGCRGALVVGSAMGFIGILVALRVLHGDWGVAYTAGAFFVALAGVLSTWIAWRASKPAH